MSTSWNVTITDPVGSDELTKLSVVNGSGIDSDYSINVQMVNGMSYEFFCDENRWKTLDSALHYREGDVIIGSFPKCGTTWLEQIVLLLLNDGRKEAMDPSAKNNYEKGAKYVRKVWPEAALLQNQSIQNHMGKQAAPLSLEDFESMPNPRVMKSHAAPNMFLGTNGQGLAGLPLGVKLLLITRNPFDACVSSYYYGHNAHRNGWPFEAWAAMFLSGLAPQGDWFEWVRGWHEQVAQYPDSALWLHYEDVQTDARAQIERIAEYLGVRRDTAAEMDALIDRVVEYSSFHSMQAQAAEHQPADGFHDPHLRKGKSGDWRNYFDTNSGIYNDFVGKFSATLAGTGLVYSLGEGNGVLQCDKP